MNKVLSSVCLKGYYSYIRLKCNARGLRFVPPNYAFFDKLLQGGIVIDVGVGENPNFTLSLINKYDVESYIIDPTHKHMNALKEFEKEHSRIHYLPLALGAKEETRTFYESQSNESGSLRKDHVNVQKDPLITYDVRVVTLERLLQHCGNKAIDIMKIDIEGEEYEFISSISKNDLQRTKQLIIEFHHNTVGKYSINETFQAINRIKSMGMKAVMYNGRDCLFYWKN